MFEKGKYYVCIGKPSTEEVNDFIASVFGNNRFRRRSTIYFEDREFYTEDCEFNFTKDKIYGPVVTWGLLKNDCGMYYKLSERDENYFQEIDVTFDDKMFKPIYELKCVRNLSIKPDYIDRKNDEVKFKIECIYATDEYIRYTGISRNELTDTAKILLREIKIAVLKDCKLLKAIRGRYFYDRKR
jgi:hypothetical protein